VLLVLVLLLVVLLLVVLLLLVLLLLELVPLVLVLLVLVLLVLVLELVPPGVFHLVQAYLRRMNQEPPFVHDLLAKVFSKFPKV
jgi:hypothetical protein